MRLALPSFDTAADAAKVSAAVVTIAASDVTPNEGAELVKAIEEHLKILEVVDLERGA